MVQKCRTRPRAIDLCLESVKQSGSRCIRFRKPTFLLWWLHQWRIQKRCACDEHSDANQTDNHESRTCAEHGISIRRHSTPCNHKCCCSESYRSEPKKTPPLKCIMSRDGKVSFAVGPMQKM